MLSKHQRLTKKDVVQTLQHGIRKVCPLLSLHILQVGGGAVRGAVVVSKKVAQHAAARNLLRRRVYTLIAAHSASLQGCHIVVQLRPIAAVASYAALAHDFSEAMDYRQKTMDQKSSTRSHSP